MSQTQNVNLLQPHLTARSGGELRVLGIARISTEHQDSRSLEDQEALYRRYLDAHYGGPYELRMITGRGSGEIVARADYLEAWDAVETQRLDLVISEDLARISRRAIAIQFCEHCEDKGTRLITINDGLDTGRTEWRMLAGFASIRHELSNTDTSNRIRRTQRNRFDNGGMVQFTQYGYIKPVEAETDAELAKDPKAEAVYDEIFSMLDVGVSYCEIADKLIAQGIPTGYYCRSEKWTGKMIARLIHNPIVKGQRVRNRRKSQRVNSTGLRRSVRSPANEVVTRACPHLAFIEPERYDRIIRKVDERNAHYRRKLIDGIDSRAGKPKKRSDWPGQHLTCGVCGRVLHFGGNGIKGHLMCSGAFNYLCWNVISVDAETARRRIVPMIHDAISNLEDFDQVFLEEIRSQAVRLGVKHEQELVELDHRISTNAREISNVLAAIRSSESSKALVDDLKQLERVKDELTERQTLLKADSDGPLLIPESAKLRAQALESLKSLSVDSQEFARLLRQWITGIVVHPVRLVDGRRGGQRAEFTLNLAHLLPRGSRLKDCMEGALTRRIVVDLFDYPQFEVHRREIIALRSQGVKQRDVAKQLGIHQPDVQRAELIQRKMDDLGVDDAYASIRRPPSSDTRWRRHHHPRFRFEPLAEYPIPLLRE